MKGMFQETSPDILVIFWSACRARAINFQPRGADSTHEGVREEETSAEVRGVAQDREGGGVVEGGWQGLLGRARAALGRFVVAVPRTLRKPFSLFRHDCRGGHDPPQTKPTPLPTEQAHTTRRQ